MVVVIYILLPFMAFLGLKLLLLILLGIQLSATAQEDILQQCNIMEGFILPRITVVLGH